MILYGLDAPYVVVSLLLFSIIFPAIQYYFLHKLSVVEPFIWVAMYISFASLFLTACFMMISSFFLKKYMINKMISMLDLKGNEKILDVGCGKGAVTIAVAQKLTTGSVVGIDIFSSNDLSGNTIQNLQHSILNSGLHDKIVVTSMNVVDMQFKDATYDVVISNLVIHNIESLEDRFVALDQMLRVLKPGGTLIIGDMFYTDEYYQYFTICDDIASVYKSGIQLYSFPPSRIIKVVKNL